MAILPALWAAVAPWPLAPPGEARGPHPGGQVRPHAVLDRGRGGGASLPGGPRLLPLGPQGAGGRRARTPEGARLGRLNPESRFHLSLGIDHPRPGDVARGADAGHPPGGDIFIHGQPEGIEGRARLKGDWTAGCIAVANASMEKIWQVAGIGTAAEIVP